MDAAIIAPTSMLHLAAARSRYQFVLAHLYNSDENYRKFYKERRRLGDRIIVDNGAYEFGSAIQIQDLVDCVLDLSPNIVVLPDVRFKTDESLALTEKGLSELSSCGARLLGVPQGDSFGEILRCYRGLAAMGVGGFGLYEEIGEVAGLGSRFWFCQYLEKNGLVCDNAYYHCLGMEENLWAVRNLATFDWLNGIDSCKPVVYGLNDVLVDYDIGQYAYMHRPKGYFGLTALTDSVKIGTIKMNCDTIVEWASGGKSSA